MDAFSLSVTITIAAAIMASGMYSLYLANRAQTCLRDWAGAGLLFFVNSALVLATSSAPPPYWMTPALHNSLLFCAHAALWVGVRRYLGQRPGWPVVALLGVVVFLAHDLPLLRKSVDQRLMILWPLLMIINFSTAWAMLRTHDFRLKSGFTPLVVLLLLNVAQHGIRAGFLITGEASGLAHRGNDLLQTSGHLALLVFILLCTVACAFLIIRDQAMQLRALAQNDAMTGWRNRRSMTQTLTQVQSHSQRHGQTFALILFDIDHFKKINDAHGHHVGDQAICHVTRAVAEELRDYEDRFRIGGEEFLVLVPAATASQAPAVAERLRQRVALAPLDAIEITVSVGVAVFRTWSESWEDTLKRADEALYAAKRNGRNRCVMHDALPQCRIPGHPL